MNVSARPTPLFLLSLPRSGSTLAQRILAAHGGIATTSEPWILLPYLYANVLPASRFRCGAWLLGTRPRHLGAQDPQAEATKAPGVEPHPRTQVACWRSYDDKGRRKGRGAALHRETPVPVLQLLQAEAEIQGPVSGSEDPDRHRGVSTLGQHVRRGCLPTGTARERPGRPPPPHAGAGDTSGQVGYTDPLAG